MERRPAKIACRCHPYTVYNIGSGTPENLLDYILTLQKEVVQAGVLPEDYDFEEHRELVGMQPGNMTVTYADSSALEADHGLKLCIGIREGLRAFAEWYKGYYQKVVLKQIQLGFIYKSDIWRDSL